MLDGLRPTLLLVVVVLFGPTCKASPLGLTVHVVPLESHGGKLVRAHFTAIVTGTCPSLSGLCAPGEACLAHTTSVPLEGTEPGPGWCVRQWQKTVPSDYSATISLGTNTKFYVSMKAGPHVRANSGRHNHPAFVALPPPLRARVSCPHHFHLSVRDLDGDKVRCRFARASQGECLDCARHSFIELDEDKCMLTFTGKAPAGQYSIHLMAEDLVPVPRGRYLPDNKPLSAVPVLLSLTVEEASHSCSAEPVATGETPEEDVMLSALPYHEVKFDVSYQSDLESVLEIALVGPPALLKAGFTSAGPLATMAVAWVRSENKLPHLLPVCFAANTKSLQSEPRCLWLYQRETSALPDGTELRCENREMRLLLPVASLTSINLTELQLNGPGCAVSHNDTYLTARIPLDGCGTKIVHAGSELVYVNTLQSVRPFTKVSRQPSLFLPLACRIPGAQVRGPKYKIIMPSEQETFGMVSFWLEIHLPGYGPLSNFTRIPEFRSLYRSPARIRREEVLLPASSSNHRALGSRIDKLDLHVMSNCSIGRAEMMVSNCMESETPDFAEPHSILNRGCSSSNSTLEVVTTKNNAKVFRLDLRTMQAQGTTMYVQCEVSLCIATLPSDKCPSLCPSSANQRMLVGSVYTSSYSVRSGPVSLIVTTTVPPTTTVNAAASGGKPAPVAAVTTPAQSSTSHAAELAPVKTVGLVLTTISIFLQHFLLY